VSVLLQGGRRRRRPLGRVAALAAVAATGAALAAWQLWPSGATTAAPAAAAAKASRARARSAPRRPQPLLFLREPVARSGRVGARAAILVDSGSGTVLWARRPHLRLPIASTTKIMTAIVALERLRPRQVIVVGRTVPRAQPFKEGLRAGERVPAWKLFYGLMLFSGNDDAVALAIAAGGTEAHFVALMNEKARLLGLRDTHFRSPSGIVDRGSYSTAWDLAALSRYAMRDPRFRTIVRTRVKRVSWAPPTYAKIYVNHNRLLGSYPGADGIKTGWTSLAGHCLVASATRHGVRLIAVVLDSPDADGDARRLLDYGFRTRG
jgi:D-alanyl-D-alanine carboxypeptidase (penicillin-binding protein 5/6)